MHWLLAGVVVLLVLMLGPRAWAHLIFRRHAVDRPDLPGTGGELARHLLDRFGLASVAVETCADDHDHYDPTTRAVRLSPRWHDGRSITAVAIATHEVGHALQHAAGDPALVRRVVLVRAAFIAERLGSAALLVLPVLALIMRAPTLGIATAVVAIVTLGLGVLVHLITLPVEWDASFGKALPVLASGYLPPDDTEAAREVLRAAAFTYVAASLASLLNFARLASVLRR